MRGGDSDTLPVRVIKRLLDGLVRALGWFFLMVLIGAALGVPWRIYAWLGRDLGEYPGAPDYIVLMGGGGIPSESGLMRSWQTAQEALRYPKARVIVAHPFEKEEGPGKPNPIVRELVLRGVSEGRILREGRGRHTREQADRIREMVAGNEGQVRLLIVTSPEHIRRSQLCFKKAGFQYVRGRGVDSKPVEADVRYGSDAGATPMDRFDRAIGNSLTLRYRLWDNLGLTVRVSRELIALLYYRLNGWI